MGAGAATATSLATAGLALDNPRCLVQVGAENHLKRGAFFMLVAFLGDMTAMTRTAFGMANPLAEQAEQRAKSQGPSTLAVAGVFADPGASPASQHNELYSVLGPRTSGRQGRKKKSGLTECLQRTPTPTPTPTAAVQSSAADNQFLPPAAHHSSPRANAHPHSATAIRFKSRHRLCSRGTYAASVAKPDPRLVRLIFPLSSSLLLYSSLLALLCPWPSSCSSGWAGR